MLRLLNTRSLASRLPSIKSPQLYAVATGATTRLLSTTPVTRSNTRSESAHEIEKLNALVKDKIGHIDQLDKKIGEKKEKATISFFLRPIILFFLVASTGYITLHWIWWSLVYKEQEEKLKMQLEVVEQKLEELRRNTPESFDEGENISKKSWGQYLKFWK